MLGGILRTTEDGSVVLAVRIRVDVVQEVGIQHGRRRLHVVAQPGCMRLHENGIRDGRVDRAAGAGRSEPREGTTIMPATVRRPRAATETAV